MSRSSTDLPIALLNQWPEDISSARARPLGTSSGLSNAAIWRLSTRVGEFCLRRWPPARPTLDELRAIHGLLRHVADAGFGRSPTPRVTLGGETILVDASHLWECTTWLPGGADLTSDPTAARLAAAMTALADFHLAAQSYQFGGRRAHEACSPGLARRLAILRTLQGGELSQLRQATRAAPANELREMSLDICAGIARSLDRVADRLVPVVAIPLPLHWCLRDVRRDHVLFSGDEVTGLIDFGAAAVDSVAGDVARLLGSWICDDARGWQAGVAAYDARRPLTDAEQQAIACFDAGGTLCSAANWLRWLFVEHRSFPQPEAARKQLTWLRQRIWALADRPGASISGAAGSW